jgi:predicted nucleotidyltransferase
MRTFSRRGRRPPQPVDVLFGAYRRRILSLLLLRPDDTFYVREIARLTGTPAGSLHRELRLLTDAGLLVRTKTGNQVRYQADRACPIFEDLAAICRKTTGLADVLRDALKGLARRIRVAFVFGSVAQGKERTVSDVDVMVIGAPSFAVIVGALNRARDRIRRDVNPVVMTEAAFRSKATSADRFVSRVIREPKIFLIGGIRELAELADDRADQGASA